ncbi:hypothetical protein CKAN_02666000 [Cinnamomum micranthum f. kanehirae]|uniref:Uncharacterized protein n=1 Tax=Cinnamomum micranthum f. kanehirae TaxID=337451 RepID=A0A443Q2M5_9MAGN|nr:hypothetical protein CKAN_02666000 [Cinnamomum micranthum f. kanehirae]
MRSYPRPHRLPAASPPTSSLSFLGLLIGRRRFLPGSSYWPSPNCRRPVVELVVGPLSEEEVLSLSTVCGWPSAAFFILGDFDLDPDLYNPRQLNPFIICNRRIQI